MENIIEVKEADKKAKIIEHSSIEIVESFSSANNACADAKKVDRLSHAIFNQQSTALSKCKPPSSFA